MQGPGPGVSKRALGGADAGTGAALGTVGCAVLMKHEVQGEVSPRAEQVGVVPVVGALSLRNLVVCIQTLGEEHGHNHVLETEHQS